MKKVTRCGDIEDIKQGEYTNDVKLITNINPKNIIRNTGCPVCDKGDPLMDGLRRDIILKKGLQNAANIVGAIVSLPDMGYEDVKKKLVSVAIEEYGKILYKDLKLPNPITTRVIGFGNEPETYEKEDVPFYDTSIALASIKNSDYPMSIKINKLNEFITNSLVKNNFVETKECQEALDYMGQLKEERYRSKERLGKYLKVLPKSESSNRIMVDVTEDVKRQQKGIPSTGLPNEENLLSLPELISEKKIEKLKQSKKIKNLVTDSENVKMAVEDMTSLGRFKKEQDNPKFPSEVDKLIQAIPENVKEGIERDIKTILPALVDGKKIKNKMKFLKASAASKRGWITRRKNMKNK